MHFVDVAWQWQIQVSSVAKKVCKPYQIQVSYLRMDMIITDRNLIRLYRDPCVAFTVSKHAGISITSVVY